MMSYTALAIFVDLKTGWKTTALEYQVRLMSRSQPRVVFSADKNGS